MEVDGVTKSDYIKVIDHCYLCDLCFLTKCPYVRPHEWNVDFPHLMLRAKANKYKHHGATSRDKILSNTDRMGSLLGIPIVAQTVNTLNRSAAIRKGMEKMLGIHSDAHLPSYQSKSAEKQFGNHQTTVTTIEAAGRTRGRVAIFTTCYGDRNEPELIDDLIKIFEHNGVATKIVKQNRCCSMPKLELGDLEAVAKNKEYNVPLLQEIIKDGWDIVAPIPFCVLMFKQELPLMFPEDQVLEEVQQSIFDPFEYLALRHKGQKLKTEFKKSLGKISYHAPCHLRVQNIGLKTKEILSLIPDTSLELIERCAGHDGTYAAKKEFHEVSMKIGRPVMNKIKKAEPDYYSSDCPLAGHHIANGVKDGSSPTHPLTLLRMAYGL